MVFPKLKGAAVAKEWQPMSEEMERPHLFLQLFDC